MAATATSAKIFRFSHRRVSDLTAKVGFTVAPSKKAARTQVQTDLAVRYHGKEFSISPFEQVTLEEVQDERVFSQLARQLDAARPSPPEVGPFWIVRYGTAGKFNQSLVVYSADKAAARAVAVERIQIDPIIKFDIRQKMESLSVDDLTSRFSGKGGVFSVLHPDDRKRFVSDLLNKYRTQLSGWHTEQADSVAEQVGSDHGLPTLQKPPKPGRLLLDGLAIVLESTIDRAALPASVR